MSVEARARVDGPAFGDRLRVLQVIAPSTYGGAETVCLSLAAALQGVGVESTLVVLLQHHGTSWMLEQAQRFGVPAVVLRTTRHGYPQAVRALRDVVLDLDPSVLHAHNTRANLIARCVAALTKRACVATLHGHIGASLRERAYDRIDLGILRTMHAVVSVSHAAVAEVRRSRPRLAARMSVVPSGITARRGLTREDALRALGVPAGTAIIGWSGRFAAEKDPELFVRAIAALAATHGPAVAWHAVMIGDGVLMERVRALADALGVAHRIHMCGARPDGSQLLSALDVLTITSRREQLPTVLLEALLHGVPVVSTPVGDVPRLAGRSGAIAITSPEPATIAATLAAMLDAPARRERMGRAGQRDVACHHDMHAWAERHRELYARVLFGASSA